MIAKLNSPLFLIPIVTLSAVLLALLVLPGAQAGGVLEVDRTDDDPASTTCAAAPNDCSLRGAISNANGDPGPNTIDLPAGTYELTNGASGEDGNIEGDLDITDDLTINGARQSDTIIQAGPSAGNGIDRAIHVHASGSLAMSAVTVRYGTPPGVNDDGGGILGAGDLVITNSTISDNAAQRSGGGIYVADSASVELSNVTFTDNSSGMGGGGLHKADGIAHTLLINDSTFSGNEGFQGGAMHVGVSDSAVINDTDITGNSATMVCGGPCGNGGGGIYVPATTLEINGGSITGNLAPTSSGGGINASNIIIDGTVIAANVAANPAGGGGLSVQNATITNANISDNVASAGPGGGILSRILDITDSSISGNLAALGGGGIHSDLDLQVARTSITDNAADSGGGIFVVGGSAALENVTFSGNNATTQGGAIHRGPEASPLAVPSGVASQGPIEISFTTLSDNAAAIGSAVSDEAPGQLSIDNSIIAGNAGGSNCDVGLTSLGYNIEDADSCGLNAVGDQINTDPLLGVLTDNGGVTLTHALLAGSPAIDAASPSCPAPATDQRGVARPQGAACDIGAFESGAPGPSATGTPIPSPTPPPSSTATPVPVGALWGDNDCDIDVDAVDALKGLQHVAAIGFSQNDPCPALGSSQTVVPASFALKATWGDVDCDGDVDAVDALNILRFVAALPSLATGADCPDIGDPVTFG